MSLLYSLNGEEPSIVGERCTGFFLEHFHEGQQITNQANVAHLRFAEQWYRLYFEAGTIFWRRSARPEPAQNTELEWGLLLNDLSGVPGIVGHVLQTRSYSGTPCGDLQVTLEFVEGRTLRFTYDSAADATRVDG